GKLIFESPLTVATAMRGSARWWLGIAGWREDFAHAITTAHSAMTDPGTLAGVMWFTYVPAIPYGVIVPDEKVLRETAEYFSAVQHSGDDLALDLARGIHGVALATQDGPARAAGFELLAETRERCVSDRFALTNLPLMDLHIAAEKARVN